MLAQELQENRPVELTIPASKSYSRNGDIFMSNFTPEKDEIEAKHQPKPATHPGPSAAELAMFAQQAKAIQADLNKNMDLSQRELADKRKELKELEEKTEETKEVDKKSFLRRILEQLIQRVIGDMKSKENPVDGKALIKTLASIASIDQLDTFVTGFQKENKGAKNPFKNYSNDQLDAAYIQWRLTLTKLSATATTDAEKGQLRQAAARYGLLDEVSARKTKTEMRDLMVKVEEEVAKEAPQEAKVAEEILPERIETYRPEVREAFAQEAAQTNVLENSKKPIREEVLENAALSDEDRIAKAYALLKEKGLLSQEELERGALSEERQKALLAAHRVGTGEGENGEDVGVFEYNTEQLKRKISILRTGKEATPEERRQFKEAGEKPVFSLEEQKELLEHGIAGGPPTAPKESAELIRSLEFSGDDKLQRIANAAKIAARNGRLTEDALNKNIDSLTQAIREGGVDSVLAEKLMEQLSNVGDQIPPEEANRPKNKDKADKEARTPDKAPRATLDVDNLTEEERKGDQRDAHTSALADAKEGSVDQPKAVGKMTKPKAAEAISEAETASELRSLIDKGGVFRNWFEFATQKGFNKTRKEEYAQELSDLLGLINPENLNESKESIRDIMTRISEEARDNRFGRVPQSIQEVADEVASMSTREWQTGGEYQLIDEKGNIVKPNFIRWVRNEMWYLHDLNPDDEQNMFNQVRLPLQYRDLSLGAMFDKRDIFFKDVKTNERMDDLYEQLLYEVWLFSTARNDDVKYRFSMGDESKIAGVLSSIYSKNVFTKEGTLKRVLDMASADHIKDGSKSIDGGDLDSKAGEMDTGKAFRAALLTYYYMSDEEMLTQIHTGGTGIKDGEKISEFTALFDNKVFVRDYALLKTRDKLIRTPDDKKEEEEPKLMAKYTKEAQNMLVSTKHHFNEDGTLKAEEMHDYVNAQDQIDGINIFNHSQKDVKLLKEVKQRVIVSLAQKYGISYEEAQYAEAFASSMTRWTGIGARNDTGALAFDAWSKVINTKHYRVRQSSKDRGAFYGNEYNVFGIQQLGVDFFTGIVESKDPNDRSTAPRSILEAIQGVEAGGDINQINIDKDVGKLDFALASESFFGVDHVNRVFNLYKFFIEGGELDFSSFMTYNWTRGWVFDHHKAQKALEDVNKQLRYAYSTWGQLDFGKKVRAYVSDPHDPKKKEWREMTVAEMMFNKEILDPFRNRDGSIDQQKIESMNAKYTKTAKPKDEHGNDIETDMERNDMWKQVLKFILASEIYSKYSMTSHLAPLSFGEIEQIYMFLEGFPVDIEEHDEGNLTSIHGKKGSHFFDKDDIQWIRDHSHTQYGKLFMRELFMSMLVGSFKGSEKLSAWAIKYALRAAIEK